MLQPLAFNFVPFVQPIYNAIFKRLTVQDQDQVRKISEWLLRLSEKVHWACFLSVAYLKNRTDNIFYKEGFLASFVIKTDCNTS